MAAVFLWPGAIAIGISLGLLGSGGSILTVPVLVYLVGQDEKLAIASSLAIVGVIALVGSLAYIREKLVHQRSVWLFGIPGMAGTYLGAASSVYVSGVTQLLVFSLVMMAAAYVMLQPKQHSPSKEAKKASRIAADGVLVGALTGFVGVGGGFLVVPALVVLGGLSMHRAIATSLIIITLKSAVGFYKYQDVLNASGTELDYDVIGLVAALGIAGSLIGGHLAQRISQVALQRVFGWFLVVMGTYIFATSIQSFLER